MGLAAIFEKAVNTVFTVFKDFVKDGKYIVAPVESGWGDDVFVEHPMKVILNGLSQDDKKNTSFYAQILPTDSIVMIKGSSVKSAGITVKTGDKFSVFIDNEWKLFNIEDKETDPAEALYTILLREG